MVYLKPYHSHARPKLALVQKFSLISSSDQQRSSHSNSPNVLRELHLSVVYQQEQAGKLHHFSTILHRVVFQSPVPKGVLHTKLTNPDQPHRLLYKQYDDPQPFD